MQITENLSQDSLTRQERLLIWLRRKGIKNVDIARALGAVPSSVTQWLEADTISSWRHKQLAEFGIPLELLPEPVDIPPGPRKAKEE